MSDVVNFPGEVSKIREEASEWIARIESRKLTSEEQASLNRWVKTSPVHRKELKRMAATWDTLSAAGAEQAKPIDGASLESIRQSRTRSPWLELSLKIAACIALVVLIPLLIHIQTTSHYTSTNGLYTTRVGEQESLKLSDGSHVMLNTDSRLLVEFESGHRNLILQRGEANFEVAHDASAPFTVMAGEGDVQALGTNFSVRMKDQSVNVLVSEGRVRIRADRTIAGPDLDQLPDNLTAGGDTVVVDAGKNVVVADKKVESVELEDKETLAQKLYWRQGFLAFENQTLSEVVEEISRYSDFQIHIVDEEVAQMKVGGYYPIDNLEAVFHTLEAGLGLSVRQVGDKVFYIRNARS